MKTWRVDVLLVFQISRWDGEYFKQRAEQSSQNVLVWKRFLLDFEILKQKF